MNKNERHNVAKDIQPSENIADKVILTPLTDIFETENELVIISEMPGVDEKSIEISFENNVILLSGKMKCDFTFDNFEEIREEFSCGIYKRSFSILSDIEIDKISAKIKEGVLKVFLPKSEKAKPKKILVNIE